jgi:arrestin-related trafficking adapter 4/5/7
MTPAPQSGMNTPFYSQSQTGSSENLASHNEPVDANGIIHPAALSSRLQNLDITSRNNSFPRRQNTLNSGGNTPHPEAGSSGSPRPALSSNVLSRRTSEEDEHNSGFSNLTSGQHTPEHIDYSDLGDLSKVPSYSTAVRAPVPSTSFRAVLPDYEAAVSVPASPLIPGSPLSTDISGSPDSARRRQAGPQVTDIEETRRLHLLQRRDGAH